MTETISWYLKVQAAIQLRFVYLSGTSVKLAVRVQRHCTGQRSAAFRVSTDMKARRRCLPLIRVLLPLDNLVHSICFQQKNSGIFCMHIWNRTWKYICLFYFNKLNKERSRVLEWKDNERNIAIAYNHFLYNNDYSWT